MEDQGVDPNLRDGDGATPLHFAASRGHLTAVRWLLSHGARLSLDKYGKSPINDAAENQQVECLNVLVQHGTVPDQNASSGSSNYEGSVYRTKVGGGNSQKKYGSNAHNYYNTKQHNLLINTNGNGNMPSQHSLHQPAAAVHPHLAQHQQQPLPPPPKIKIPKSPESTSNSCSSDTEPFYLHPPSMNGGGSIINGPIVKDGLIYGAGSQGSVRGSGGGGGGRQSSTSPVDYGTAIVPNDGLYVNPMRQGSLTPPSPGGSISGESFYLHDPQEVIYNRVKDLFDSDSSSVNNNTYPSSNGQHNNINNSSSSNGKDGSGSSHKNTNALTGTGRGSGVAFGIGTTRLILSSLQFKLRCIPAVVVQAVDRTKVSRWPRPPPRPPPLGPTMFPQFLQ